MNAFFWHDVSLLETIAYSNFFREIKKGNRIQGFSKYKSKKNRQIFRTNNQKTQ